MRLRTIAALVLGLSLSVSASCGGGELEGPTVEESAALREGGSVATSAQKTIAVADSLFDFDPTIDPNATPEANAAAIAANTRDTLMGCGAVAVTGTSVSVSFGAPPGCMLRTGVRVSGAVTATVSREGNSAVIALAFTQLVVDGHAINGSAVFRTQNGSTFAVTLSLMSGSDALTGSYTVVGASGQFTVSGAGSVVRGGATTSVQLEGVVYRRGDCYPSAGTMRLTRGAIAVTVTFTAATAASGQVSVTQGRRSYNATLPSYGSCPSS